MSFVRLAIQGESHLGIVNTEQITYITQGLYGASIHFASGEYLVCDGDLDEVSAKLFGERLPAPAPIPSEDLLIASPRAD